MRQTDTCQYELQFMHSARVLLDSIAPQLFTAQQPMHVFILFGATASRPSELYSLTFPATGGNDPSRHCNMRIVLHDRMSTMYIL